MATLLEIKDLQTYFYTPTGVGTQVEEGKETGTPLQVASDLKTIRL